MKVSIGDPVVYVDERSVRRAALLTAVWDNGDQEKYPNPSVNLVFVSGDETKTDSCGRQTERRTSIPHGGDQTAPGNCWVRVNE